ncbi:hypothetical protein [Micromonospora siamensis]|uniref:hypothetical protein n=1 Tax=Micromonospora siamensis TaxID=299152 RepID=UPI0035ED7E96
MGLDGTSADRVLTALLAMQRQSWEQGVAGHALLEGSGPAHRPLRGPLGREPRAAGVPPARVRGGGRLDIGRQ